MKKSLVVALGLLAGCASNPPTPDHPAAAATPAAAPAQDDVQLLAAYPKTDYEDLGTFQFTFFRGGMLTPSLESVMTELKEKVRHAGGNAFVVLNQSPDRADKRVLHVSAEVLKVK
jgi:hypothetical protein